MSIRLTMTIIFFLGYVSQGLSNIILGNPTNFRNLVDNLVPGDTLYLVAGNYTQSLRIENIQGNLFSPIFIGGQPGFAKPVFLGNNCCNTVSLTKCSFLHLSNIVCDGQSIAGIDGIKAEGSVGNWTHDITISNFEIVNYGADQQNVGISTKCPSWNWKVRHNIIDQAGTGMYFGNSNGEEPFVGSIVEYNLIINTVGYNCQVKHQNNGTRDIALGMPEDAQTIIRYNVFSKAQNASSGSSARPNLLVGNFPSSGNGSSDYYEIYGNFFFQNPTEGLFQGTGNIGFYDNVLFNSLGGWGILIQTHVGFQPRAIDVFHNTVLINNNNGLSMSGLNTSFTQRAYANAVFSNPTISGGDQFQNITGLFSGAALSFKSPQVPINNIDLTPLNGALVISNLELNDFSKYSNFDIDFEGKIRNGSFAGAYYSSDSAQWPLQLAIRDDVIRAVTSSAQILVEPESVTVFPCPTTGIFRIEGMIEGYAIEILDVAGNVYQQVPVSGNLIDLDISMLPVGIFFVSIRNIQNNLIEIQKIIKQ